MNSNYGESVKFYEKISTLHGQLKNYEEEQFTLEEEFQRLRTQPMETMTDLASNTNVDVIGSIMPRGILKIDGLSIEENRRKRNSAILEKMKELESNASVFAARSEKLRIMRAEYEMLVKKHIEARKLGLTNKNLNGSFNGRQPYMSNTNDTKKSLVSVGVNTNITGAVKPIGEGHDLNYTDSLLMSSNTRGGKHVDFTDSKNEFQLNPPQFRSNNYTQPNMSLLNYENGHGIENYSASNFLVDQIQLESNNNQHYLNIQKSLNLNENIGGENDESLRGKLHHNPYFDLSTTSDSELTSTVGGVGNLIKKNNMMPISINLGDTTQSDTMSLSVQIPSKYNTILTHKRSSQLFNLSTTTDQSESTAIHSHPHHQDEQEINLKEKQSKSHKNKKSSSHPMDSLSETQMTGRDEEKDDDDEDGEEDMENDKGIVSDSLTTSPGDSVMDSIQNRTLNESLPRGGGRGDNNLEEPTPVNFHEENQRDETKLMNESNQGKWETIANVPEPLVHTPQWNESNKMVMKKDGNVNNNPTTMMHKPQDEFGFQTQFLADGAKFGMENKFKESKQNDEKDQHGWGHYPKLQSPQIARNEGTMEEGRKEETTGKIEEEDQENKKLVPSVQSSPRPKTGAVGTNRRVKIKLDYEDTDSESLDLVHPSQTQQAKGDNRGSLKAGDSQEPMKGKQVDTTDDDDFDDFFDI